jgi:hypothetical protein
MDICFTRLITQGLCELERIGEVLIGVMGVTSFEEKLP